jgi:23S rRNA (adenine2503-C2)-methyltransferase
MNVSASLPRSTQAKERTDLLELTDEEFASVITEFLTSAGEPGYRSRQLRDWVYRRTPTGFSGMSDVPKHLRERLGARFTLHPLEKKLERLSRDSTRKFLWSRPEGGVLESVLIPERERTTYCISTQAGCPVKCTFCATGYGGFEGNLRASEIVDQVLRIRQSTDCPPTNIVYMGMGEPLLNFPAVIRSLKILTHADQVGFGARRITVSTVGIPERIRELGTLFPQVKLALSLHAARDELRDQIIPLNRKYGLKALLAATREHAQTTGRKVTFEYVVLPGVNDSEGDAREVAALVQGIPSGINLIGFNPFPGAPYSKPPVKRLLDFRQWLGRTYRGPVTIRRSRGEDIEGACGQLSLSRDLPGLPRETS